MKKTQSVYFHFALNLCKLAWIISKSHFLPIGGTNIFSLLHDTLPVVRFKVYPSGKLSTKSWWVLYCFFPCRLWLITMQWYSFVLEAFHKLWVGCYVRYITNNSGCCSLSCCGSNLKNIFMESDLVVVCFGLGTEFFLMFDGFLQLFTQRC